MTLPLPTEPFDIGGQPNREWYTWARRLQALTNSGTDLTAVEARLTALEAVGASISYFSGTGVTVYGSGEIGLTQLANSATGALLGITRDIYGRVSGTTDATITGTPDRVSVANGNAAAGVPTIDIAATYAGQPSITTLGTVGAGVWQATAVGLAYGGTGQDYSTRVANTVWAGPTGGADAAPAFRALVAADIPDLSGVYQPLDGDLTVIAALTPSNDDFLQRKAGAWANRTIAQVKADLSLSGTNTGDQTSIVGITGTLAEFNAALTGADFATGGGTATGTNTGDQTSIVGITGTLAQFNTACTDADFLSVAAAAAAYQPLDTQLTSLAALSYAGNGGMFIRLNAGETDFEFAAGGGSAAWGSITGTLSDQTDLQTALNAKQPLDATLTALAAANWAANALPIGSGADTLAQVSFAANTFPARASSGNLVAKTITDFGLSLVDDADASAARTTLALGTAATQNTGTSGANVPLLNGANTWSATQTVDGALLVTGGAFRVDRAGDTAAGQILIDVDAGQQAQLSLRTGSSPRFSLQKNATAESGANAGSDLSLTAYDDSGVSLGTVLSATRSSRVVNFNLAPTLSAGQALALGDGGTGAELADPGADRLMFWDDSAGAVTWLTLGTNLTITGTTLDASGGGGSLSDGDKGDITVSGSGATWTIDNDAVTYAKFQNASATKRALGRNTAAAGDFEEVTAEQILSWIGTPAQGDVLYHNGTNMVRLAAGSVGQGLFTNGGAANPEWAGTAKKLGTYIVAGAAATTMPLDLSAIDMSPYKALEIRFRVKNNTGSNSNISLFWEGDTTATNYDRQLFTYSGTTASGGRANDGVLFTLAANGLACGVISVQSDIDSDLRSCVQVNEGITTAIVIRFAVHTYRSGVAITDVDTITLSSAVASAFAIGSEFTVWGLC